MNVIQDHGPNGRENAQELIDEQGAELRFPSLSALRRHHRTLLQSYHQQGVGPALQAEMQRFVSEGRNTGRVLYHERDRLAAQSLLDYWSSLLYHTDQHHVDATLAEFDPLSAPDLPDDACPYVGLNPFREAEHELFFGRQREVEEMTALLGKRRLVAALGPSGSGKSSLVMAGLLPALKSGRFLPGSEQWHYPPPVVPGSRPLFNLAAALQPPITPEGWREAVSTELWRDDHSLLRLANALSDRPVVLVIDQLEELFTLNDGEAAHRFLANVRRLVEAPGRQHRVILTLRTDFEARLAINPDFQEHFTAGAYRVTPLAAAELRQAIIGPAEHVGLVFERGVVEGLLHDLLGEPAGLPLLQFTLRRLWRDKQRNRITLESYERLGGGRLALARTADELYEQLIPENQQTMRRILLCMVRPGDGLEATGSRILRSALYESGEDASRVDDVLNRLLESGLVRLTPGEIPTDDQVGIAHEALLRNWPRLIRWIDEERYYLGQRQSFQAAVRQWIESNYHADTLLRGRVLHEALAFKDLNPAERAFLKASVDAARAAKAARQRDQEARIRAAERLVFLEKQRTRTQRRYTMVLAIISLIACTVALWAVRAQMQANSEAQMRQAADIVALGALNTRIASLEEQLGAMDTPSPLESPPPAGTPPASTATAAAIRAEVDALRATQSAISPAIPLGYSAGGQAINLSVVGSGAQRVVIIGGLDGWRAPVVLVEQLAMAFRADPSLVPAGVTLHFIANANPDSTAGNSQLNLNDGWACGEEPAGLTTQPEVQVLHDHLLETQPALVILLNGRQGGTGFVMPGFCENISPNARALAAQYTAQTGYSNILGGGDTLTNWLAGRGIPTLHVLLPVADEMKPAVYEENLAALLAVLGETR